MKKILFSILLLSIIMLSGCGNSSSNNDNVTWSCVDVTSYDHNWDNDMKCKSSDGKVRYTSYEGARLLRSL